jgi:hypothetical protein
VATIYATRFHIQKQYVLLTECIYVFRIKPKTNITSLHGIDRLVFIVEERVHCAVRTKFLKGFID